MVKSPDLLGGLLDKEVGRRGMLKVVGFTGALATLAACSDNDYPEKKPVNPSTADTPTETVDAQPTQTPTPTETTTTPEKPLPDPEQLISPEKAEELFGLISWKEEKGTAGDEKAAADNVATKLKGMVNGIINPLTLVGDEHLTELGLGQHVENEELKKFCEDLQKRVAELFFELTTVDPTQKSIPDSMGQLAEIGKENTLVALTQCSESESPTNGGPLTVERHVNPNGEKVLYYTYFVTQPHIRRIEFTGDIQNSLNPQSSSAVCQKVNQDLRKIGESRHFVFDFAPGEEGRMQIIDIRVKNSVNEP